MDMEHKMYKAVLFDLDGVLVDACEWHRTSLNDALREICNYEISMEDHYKEFNGIPTKVKLKKLSDMGVIDTSCFKAVESLKQQKTIEVINKLAFVRQEKIELMEYLKQKNIKIVCYTNSICETATLMLEKTGIKQYFDLIVTNQDVNKPKPDPEGYNYCINTLALSKNEVIIIEDSDKGFQAAIASGAKVIRVKNQDDVTIDLIRSYI